MNKKEDTLSLYCHLRTPGMCIVLNKNDVRIVKDVNAVREQL